MNMFIKPLLGCDQINSQLKKNIRMLAIGYVVSSVMLGLLGVTMDGSVFNLETLSYNLVMAGLFVTFFYCIGSFAICVASGGYPFAIIPLLFIVVVINLINQLVV